MRNPRNCSEASPQSFVNSSANICRKSRCPGNLTKTFNVRSLGELVARALGLQPGDDVEIARDRLNPNRLLVLRSPSPREDPIS